MPSFLCLTSVVGEQLGRDSIGLDTGSCQFLLEGIHMAEGQSANSHILRLGSGVAAGVTAKDDDVQ